MKDCPEFKIVLTTAPDLDVAKHLAESAINARLAACVSFLPGLESLYWWKGQIETTTEVIMLLKTEAARVEELEKLIIHHHPYDTPELAVLPVEAANEKYLAWITTSLKAEAPVAGATASHS
jgi:periplasmic divalent cation tolerance protein